MERSRLKTRVAASGNATPEETPGATGPGAPPGRCREALPLGRGGSAPAGSRWERGPSIDAAASRAQRRRQLMWERGSRWENGFGVRTSKPDPSRYGNGGEPMGRRREATGADQQCSGSRGEVPEGMKIVLAGVDTVWLTVQGTLRRSWRPSWMPSRRRRRSWGSAGVLPSGALMASGSWSSRMGRAKGCVALGGALSDRLMLNIGHGGHGPICRAQIASAYLWEKGADEAISPGRSGAAATSFGKQVQDESVRGRPVHRCGWAHPNDAGAGRVPDQGAQGTSESGARRGRGR